MNTDKIGRFEAISSVLIIMVGHLILNLPNTILTSTISAAPLNVIYITALALIFFLVTDKLFSPFHNKDILDVAEYVGGEFLKKLLSVIYTLYLIFIAGILVLSFADTLKTVYLHDMPTPLICLLFILIGILANHFGFKSVSRINAILMVFILINITMIFISLLGEFKVERFFPLLGYGANETFLTGASNIFAFGELIILFLMRPNLHDSKETKQVGIISILLSGFLLLISVSTLLLLYPFISSGEGVLSIYMITRSIHFGNFFQRVDAFFILLWALIFFSYISVVLTHALKMNKKITSINNSSPLVYLIGLGIFIVTLIPQDIAQIRVAENVIYKYASLIVVFGFSFIILLLGYLKKKRQSGLVKINTEVNVENNTNIGNY